MHSRHDFALPALAEVSAAIDDELGPLCSSRPSQGDVGCFLCVDDDDDVDVEGASCDSDDAGALLCAAADRRGEDEGRYEEGLDADGGTIALATSGAPLSLLFVVAP